ncbi:TetR/AcrR family transcriptional regulator [Microbacterium gilvum]|uniref:TetR/AcrR family transcriptional regulator n=1 Tax=Microbacterium gilvum TaxID=1336204 RepID=A0ABP9AAN9_9MICO
MADEREGPRPNRGPAAAADNRRALIAAAREEFAAGGLEVAFSAIARRAGVGQGSLYRHFPTKIELAAAVFEDNIDELERAGSLDALFDAIVAQARMSAAFLDAVVSARDVPAVQHIGERMAVLVGALLAADQAAGRVDGAIAREDVLLVVTMLARTVAAAAPEEQADVLTRSRALFARALSPR